MKDEYLITKEFREALMTYFYRHADTAGLEKNQIVSNLFKTLDDLKPVKGEEKSKEEAK